MASSVSVRPNASAPLATEAATWRLPARMRAFRLTSRKYFFASSSPQTGRVRGRGAEQRFGNAGSIVPLAVHQVANRIGSARLGNLIRIDQQYPGTCGEAVPAMVGSSRRCRIGQLCRRGVRSQQTRLPQAECVEDFVVPEQVAARTFAFGQNSLSEAHRFRRLGIEPCTDDDAGLARELFENRLRELLVECGIDDNLCGLVRLATCQEHGAEQDRPVFAAVAHHVFPQGPAGIGRWIGQVAWVAWLGAWLGARLEARLGGAPRTRGLGSSLT